MSIKRFRAIKPEIRVLGVDDGVFEPRTEGIVPIVGVVFRGGYWLDGVMYTSVKVDGDEATEKIAEMILNSPHYKQLRIIMLDGVTFAGFNVVDIKKLNETTGLPVVAITREKPDLEDIHKALKKLPKSEERWQAILNAGEIFKLPMGDKGEAIYLQIAGIRLEDAEKIIRLTATRSNVPEALRVAHLIASGLGNILRK
ncbi:DUF99 family protein [Candidatus Bathyarchaeota archaeon]|nr:DUF99 family protein [Candidatus Bathyarchaeota archaeon]